MKRLCRTADRQFFGVRSLETAFPFPRLRLQSGVEPPHSLRRISWSGCAIV